MPVVTVLQFLCIVGETVVLVQALRYKLWRALPLFVCYLTWNFLSDLFTCPLFGWSNVTLWHMLQVIAPVDLVTQMVVLVELSWQVLRGVFTGRVRGVVIGLACTAVLLFALVWPVTARLTDLQYPYNVVVRLQQAEPILGAFWIVMLGVVSVIYSIAWRERFFQIAVGVFCYALCGVLVIVYRLWEDIDAHGTWLQPISIVAYVGVLAYWIKSFSVADKHHPWKADAALASVLKVDKLTGDGRRRRGEYPDNRSGNVHPERPEPAKALR